MSNWTSSKQDLPPFNRLVVAYLEGGKGHSDAIWPRTGYALLCRYSDKNHTAANGWASDLYERALERMDADYAEVTHWMLLDPPPEGHSPQEAKP